MVIISKEVFLKIEIYGFRVSNFGVSLLGGGVGGFYRFLWFKIWIFN